MLDQRWSCLLILQAENSFDEWEAKKQTQTGMPWLDFEKLKFNAIFFQSAIWFRDRNKKLFVFENSSLIRVRLSRVKHQRDPHCKRGPVKWECHVCALRFPMKMGFENSFNLEAFSETNDTRLIEIHRNRIKRGRLVVSQNAACAFSVPCRPTYTCNVSTHEHQLRSFLRYMCFTPSVLQDITQVAETHTNAGASHTFAV